MPFFSTIVFLIYLTARSVQLSIAPATQFEETPVKTALLFASYAFAAAMAVVHYRTLERTLLRLWPFVMLCVIVFATSFNGDSSVSLLRGGHVLGLFLMAVCADLAFRGDYDRFLRVMLRFCLTCMALSIVTVIVLPARGMVNPAWNNLRWVGVTGHPNLLGAIGIAGMWALLSLAARHRWTMGSMLRGGIAAIVILIPTVLSDSRTSQLTIAVMVALFWILGGSRLRPASIATRLVIALCLVGFGAVTLSALGMNLPFFGVREGATDSLSGRPEIWAAGIDTILNHPFGISNDNLTAYWARSTINAPEKYTHFHDGYLDVTAKGGVIAGVALLLILGKMLRDVGRTVSVDYGLFRSGMMLTVSLMFYNLQETSFMRENILWSLQIIAWLMLIVSYRRTMDETAEDAGDEDEGDAADDDRLAALAPPVPKGRNLRA